MLPFAVRTGLEPATPGVTGRYSNQLNYRTNVQTFEPMEGIEPTTPRLQITCSGQLSYIGNFVPLYQRGCKDITFYDISYILLITFLEYHRWQLEIICAILVFVFGKQASQDAFA